MENKLWVASPSKIYRDVVGEIDGVFISMGQSVCWHIAHIDGIRTVTGYTIVEREWNEEASYRTWKNLPSGMDQC